MNIEEKPKDAKKKILIASDAFLPRWDGVSRFLNEIIPRISEDSDISVAAPDYKGEFMGYENVTITRFPLRKFKVADYTLCKPSYRKIKELVKGCDIVWAQSIGPVGAFAVMAARRQEKPVIAYVHSIEWELFPRSLSVKRFYKRFVYFCTRYWARFIYNKCDLLMVPSSEVGDIFTMQGITTPKRVIHLGTDAEKFMPPLSKELAKEAIGISPNKRVIGFCGRIGLEKDILTLFRAYVRLHRKYRDTVLLIVGQDEGNSIKRLPKRNDVIIVGFTNNVVKYLQALDIYVLPSLTETTSLSTLEAMSCETAVVATPVGYVKEYIKNGYNGFLFPKKDSYKLFMKLEKLLIDENLRKEMAKNARKTVISKFSWEDTTRRIKEAFDIF